MKFVLIVWAVRMIVKAIAKNVRIKNIKVEKTNYNRVIHPAEFALR
jgi:hypothetical protein